jgi:hypothetical protein
MKYALLIYQPKGFEPKSLSPEEHAEIAAAYKAVTGTPNVTPGPPLGLPATALTVQVDANGIRAVASPYMGEEGAVGGYLIFDAETEEEAVTLAARIPAARLGGAVEIRRCEVYW